MGGLLQNTPCFSETLLLLPDGYIPLDDPRLPEATRASLRHIAPSIGRLVARSKFGSAIVSESGIITAHHLTKSLRDNFRVVLPSSPIRVQFDPELRMPSRDISLHRPMSPLKHLKSTLTLSPNAHLEPGTRIAIIGHPVGSLQPLISMGNVIKPDANNNKMLWTTATAAPGSSGSGVFAIDSKGAILPEALGILHTGRGENVATSIPTELPPSKPTLASVVAEDLPRKSSPSPLMRWAYTFLDRLPDKLGSPTIVRNRLAMINKMLLKHASNDHLNMPGLNVPVIPESEIMAMNDADLTPTFYALVHAFGIYVKRYRHYRQEEHKRMIQMGSVSYRDIQAVSSSHSSQKCATILNSITLPLNGVISPLPVQVTY